MMMMMMTIDYYFIATVDYHTCLSFTMKMKKGFKKRGRKKEKAKL